MLDIIARGFMGQFPTQQTTQKYAQPLSQLAHQFKPSILLACMPKSGSTFLANVLSRASGYPKTSLVYGWERNEQDLYLPRLVQCAGVSTVTQQHTRATGPNLELIRIFNLRVIVLVRNIFDVVISLIDHTANEDFRGPSGYLSDDFPAMTIDEKVDVITDIVLPWYFGFYVSWCDAEKTEQGTCHWISFEDFVADGRPAVREALRFCGVDSSDDVIAQAIDAARSDNVRFNQGTVGRGRDQLSADQKARIARYASHYPSVDFSGIGIPSSHSHTGEGLRGQAAKEITEATAEIGSQAGTGQAG